MNLLVIDLSHYDPASNYEVVKASGIAGVIYKCTQGSTNVDETYLGQRAQALDAGLLWGAYHFGDGSNVDGQTQNFLKHAKIGADDLICLDYEDYPSSQMHLSQAQAWVTGVETALDRDNDTVLYSGNRIKEDMTPAGYGFWETRRLWLAQYGPTADVPLPWHKYWLWQYTDSGTVPGVPGARAIDCNHFDGTAEELSVEWSFGVSRVERVCPTCKQPWPHGILP